MLRKRMFAAVDRYLRIPLQQLFSLSFLRKKDKKRKVKKCKKIYYSAY